MSNTAATTEHPEVVGKLSTLDRYLAVWIGVAMVVGLLVGRWIPGVNTALDKVQIDGISLPIALGLLIMMYPVLAKVRYDRLDTVTGDKKLLAGSLFLNWVLGPALMFALAWLFLPDLPEYRTGLIIVGHRSLHRDGDHLERPGLRRPRSRRGAGRHQLGVPGDHCSPCSVGSTSRSCPGGSASNRPPSTPRPGRSRNRS